MPPDDSSRITQLKSDVSLFRVIAITFVVIVTTSTIFFHFVENWEWLDSIYFTLVTISTVGYGNFVPVTVLGKIGNIVLIVLGIGIFTMFITLLVKRQGLRRIENKEDRTHRL